jgi:hypothetical protein
MRPEYRLRSIIEFRHLNSISGSEAICKVPASQNATEDELNLGDEDVADGPVLYRQLLMSTLHFSDLALGVAA